MPILVSMIRKETLHLVRDFRTMVVVLIMPLVLLILFGFAISTEVNNINVIAVVEQHTDATRNTVEKIRVNPYCTLVGVVPPSEVDDMLRTGKAQAAVVLRTDNGQMQHQIIVDASETNTAQTASAYLESIMADTQQSPVVSKTLYNPLLKSAYNFVPGIMGMIFILICAMMTSVSIVSEKESGTMDLMLVSPVKSHTIIIGKLIPYFLLSCIILTLMLVLAYTVLGVPFSASAVDVVWVSLIYIVLSLAIGLMVSTLVRTQIAALLVSAVVFMLPVIMLSGMIFPIENMPEVIQYISCAIPARWYIASIRTLMIQQLPASYIATEAIILGGMTLVVLSVAILNFKRKQ